MSRPLCMRSAVLLLIGISLVSGGCSKPTDTSTTQRAASAPERSGTVTIPDKPAEHPKGTTQAAPETPASTDNKPADYEGYHDGNADDTIGGWVWDKNHPDRTVKVDIYDGDKRLTIVPVPADILRPDLKEAGKGTGKYAFAFPVPESLKDGKTHSIRVKIAGTNMDLTDTPLPYPPAPGKDRPDKP